MQKIIRIKIPVFISPQPPQKMQLTIAAETSPENVTRYALFFCLTSIHIPYAPIPNKAKTIDVL